MVYAVLSVTEADSQIIPIPQHVNTNAKTRTEVESRTKKSKLHSTEKHESQQLGLTFNVLVPAVTRAHISADVQEETGTSGIVLARTPFPTRRERRVSIAELPRPSRLVTTFEPHLRQATVKRLQDLFVQLRQAIGQPDAATVTSELRAVLTDTYKRSVQSQETRNFATAISLLQDFLRPHWSQLSLEKLDQVSDRLGTLGSYAELNARLLQKFYRDLFGVIGNRIAVNLAVDDDGDDGEDEPADSAA
jgi:hypothetical protein